MKCGTTALYEYIIQHPDVEGSLTKEVHFFDRRYTRGLSWYRRHFPFKSRLKGKLTGEASPYYLFHPAVARRIKETLPAVKLIALLRNPVDRAYSHYHHTKRKGFETLSFEEALACEEERMGDARTRLVADAHYHDSQFQAYSYVTRGLYAEQLERYYDVFDQEQIYVIKSEDLFEDAQAVVNGVAAFLGLSPFPLSDASPRNKAGYRREVTGMHQQLAEQFRPHNERLYKLLGRSFDWDQKYGL